MYCAELDSENVVLRVIVADSLEWCAQQLGGVWVETFIDAEDAMYAGIGYEWIPERANFRPPAPFASWTFDLDAWRWASPVPCPPKGGTWDEAVQCWST